VARQKLFLNYKSVKLYRGLKGNVEQNFAYTKKPNNQIEGGYDWFDIRRVPRKYRSGLDIDPSYSTAFSATGVDQIEYERTDRMHREAHEEVLRRAIDDDYDFEAATRDNYGQFFRRLKRWWRMKSSAESAN
jgi:hypothetical protein